jgi:hypothetical protein
MHYYIHKLITKPYIRFQYQLKIIQDLEIIVYYTIVIS